MSNIFSKEKGSITVLIACVLIPIIIFEGLLVDITKVFSAKEAMNAASELAINAALANYDRDLRHSFGIFAVDSSEADSAAKISYNATINPKYSGVATSGKSSSLYLNGNTEVYMVPGSSLDNDDVLRNQIYQYEKYYAPATLTDEDIDAIFYNIDKLFPMLDVVEDQMEFDKRLYQMQKELQKIFNVMVWDSEVPGGIDEEGNIHIMPCNEDKKEKINDYLVNAKNYYEAAKINLRKWKSDISTKNIANDFKAFQMSRAVTWETAFFSNNSFYNMCSWIEDYCNDFEEIPRITYDSLIFLGTVVNNNIFSGINYDLPVCEYEAVTGFSKDSEDIPYSGSYVWIDSMNKGRLNFSERYRVYDEVIEEYIGSIEVLKKRFYNIVEAKELAKERGEEFLLAEYITTNFISYKIDKGVGRYNMLGYDKLLSSDKRKHDVEYTITGAGYDASNHYETYWSIVDFNFLWNILEGFGALGDTREKSHDIAVGMAGGDNFSVPLIEDIMMFGYAEKECYTEDESELILKTYRGDNVWVTLPYKSMFEILLFTEFEEGKGEEIFQRVKHVINASLEEKGKSLSDYYTVIELDSAVYTKTLFFRNGSVSKKDIGGY